MGGKNRIAIISDEISQDFKTSVTLGLEWEISNFEIRGINSRRVPDISDNERTKTLQIIKEYGINITGITPGLFKIPLDDTKLNAHLNKHLYASFKFAHQVETDKIIVFGFIKPEGENSREYPHQVVDLLGRIAQKAKGEGITLALENEAGCWADTGEVTADIVSKVGAENLGINWDPCNAWLAGKRKPYPQGYEKVKRYINHLHIKDIVKKEQNGGFEFVNIGEGELNWKSQIESLIKDGFNGYYTVETHFGPKVETSKACIENLKKIISEVKRNSNP